MSKLDIIDEVLNNNYKPTDQSKLIEENVNANGRRFVMNIPIINNHLPFNLYRFDPDELDFFPYFSDLSGLKKISDYILFVEEHNYMYVFLIELKKGTASAKEQLKATEEFVKYVINSAKRIGKELDDNIAIRQIRISERKINRRKLNEDGNFDYLDNYLDYKYKNFYLKPLMQN